MPTLQDTFGIPKFKDLSPDAQTRKAFAQVRSDRQSGLWCILHDRRIFIRLLRSGTTACLNRKVTTNFGFYDENLTLDEMVGEYFISQDYLYAELIELIGIELDYRSIEIEGAEPFHILRHRGLPYSRWICVPQKTSLT